jgi:hypothetical protein
MNGGHANKSRWYASVLLGRENIIALALTFGLLVVVLATQQRLTVSDGQGWDGVQYVTMATGGGRVMPPYHLRIGYPFLARSFAFFPKAVDNFALLSTIIGTCFTWLSYRAIFRWFPSVSIGVRLFAWALINLSELGPLRFAQWYPANTDYPFNLIFLILFMVLLEDWGPVRKGMAYVVIFLVGTLIRENFVVSLALVGLVQLVEFDQRRWWVILKPARVLPFFGAIAGTVAAAVIIRLATGDWLSSGKTDTMDGWLKAMRFAPFVQSFLAVYGFAILLYVASLGWSPVWRKHSGAMVVFLLMTIPFAITGGENYERFLFWYIVPVVYLATPMIEVLWKGRRWLEMASAIGHVFVIHRFYAPIDPLSEHSLETGCAFMDYLKGYSPHLSNYAIVCRTDNCIPYFAFFGGCLLLVIAARSRIRLGDVPPDLTQSTSEDAVGQNGGTESRELQAAFSDE